MCDGQNWQIQELNPTHHFLIAGTKPLDQPTKLRLSLPIVSVGHGREVSGRWYRDPKYNKQTEVTSADQGMHNRVQGRRLQGSITPKAPKQNLAQSSKEGGGGDPGTPPPRGGRVVKGALTGRSAGGSGRLVVDEPQSSAFTSEGHTKPAVGGLRSTIPSSPASLPCSA